MLVIITIVAALFGYLVLEPLIMLLLTGLFQLIRFMYNALSSVLSVASHMLPQCTDDRVFRRLTRSETILLGIMFSIPISISIVIAHEVIMK